VAEREKGRDDVPGRVVEMAVRFPHAAAIVEEGQTLAYGELVARASTLALAILRCRQASDAVVAIAMPRSADCVVAMLGVMLAGASYLVIDETMPAARAEFMVEDSGAVLVIEADGGDGFVKPGKARELPYLALSDLDEDEPEAGAASAAIAPPPHPEQGAYLIYTSGSTGRPKGVLVPHRGLANLADWYGRYFGLAADDRAGQVASFAFDASAYEIWPTLCVGAALYMVPGRLRGNAVATAAFLADHGVSQAFLPTPLAEALFEWTRTPTGAAWARRTALKALTVAGDRLHAFAPPGLGFRIVNAYGPTENSVATTVDVVPLEPPEGLTHPSIGAAIDGVEVHVLDEDLAPAAIGELWIAGAGLARGYQGRPGLTAERFAPDPFSRDGRRMYRTGDQVRRLADGRLEFVGRLDDQVKVNGVRVELGEVESALRDLDGVRQAAVVLRSNRGVDQLIGYCEAAADLKPFDLRRRLLERLPASMVPARLVVLAALPVNASGKVDRRALPDPAPGRDDLETPYVAPADGLETELADLFAETLGVEMVGVDDGFFALGGNSLLATRLLNQIAARLSVELELVQVFQAATVRRLAAEIRTAAPIRRPFDRLERPARPPLAIQQEQIYFLHQMNPQSTAYNAVARLEIKGPLDVPLLEDCLSRLVERHEIYRTEFVQHEGAPYQRVRPPWRVTLPRLSLEQVAPEQRDAEVSALLAKEAAWAFDLDALPLVRWTLVRLADDEHVLLHVEHHLVHDGWSFNLLLRELTELYADLSRGLPSRLPPPSMQFADYATWQRDWLEGAQAARQRDYWRERLRDAPPPLRLPFERAGARSTRAPSATLQEHLPETLVADLQRLGERWGATLFGLMLSTFKALLHRYTGDDDLVVGTGLANRTRAEFEGALGMFVNVVALRDPVSGDDLFEDLAHRVSTTLLEALGHQDLPFAEVIAVLNPDRDPRQTPVCQMAFSFHDSELPSLDLPDLTLTVHEGSSLSCAKFDLNVIVIPRAQRRRAGRTTQADTGLTVIWEYNTDLFGEDSMRRMFRHYVRLLRSVVERPDSRVADLPLLETEERRRLIAAGRGGGEPAPGPSAPSRVWTQAVERPDHVALVGEDETVTYGQLWRRASRLARTLENSGLRPGQTVGVLASRSPEAVIAMLAVFNAGATYLYLDPTLPPARLDFMLRDAGVVRLLATPDRVVDVLPPATCQVLPIAWDEDDGGEAGPPRRVPPGAPAYLIYTSGSTGAPKAVVVPHSALANLIDWHLARFAVGPADRIAQSASLSFDASVWEICTALCGGATLHILPDETRADAMALSRFFERFKITAAFLPTPVGEAFLDRLCDAGKAPPTLRLLLLGGDRLRRFAPSNAPFELVNAYGPTENAVVATAGTVGEAADDGGVNPSIGRPIDGVSAHVLDGDLQPVPETTMGGLYLGGASLAQGYLGKPALTAERFIPDPFSDTPGARLYHTGDGVRRRTDGQIDFFGRTDGQVKIRGLRIELGEIEAVLRGHPAIADVAVRVRPGPDGEPLLAAWIVARTPITRRDLQGFLQARLPIHMTPALWLEIDRLPLTANGKVNERALPTPGAEEGGRAQAVAPRSATERWLAQAWSEILGATVEDINAGFFELGGNSLQLMRLSNRLRAQSGLETTLYELYRRPLLAEQAVYVDALRGVSAGDSAKTEEEGRTRPGLSPTQKRLWFLQQLNPLASAYNIPLRVRIDGPLDVAGLQRALGLLAARHSVLRARFVMAGDEPVHALESSGPLLWVGDCSGEPDPEREVDRLIDLEAHRPFSLDVEPPVAFRLYRLAGDRHVLFVNLHHIVADGWSVGVLFRDLAQFYGAPLSLAEITPDHRYFDHVDAQRRALDSGELAPQVAFWRARLADAPRELNLALARPRPPQQAFEGAQVDLCLGGDLRERVELAARRGNQSPFALLLAAYHQLLAVHADQDDLLIGANIAGRSNPASETVCGLFADTVVLRMDPGPEASIADLLASARRALLDAMAHQGAPFDKVVEALAWPRDASRNPIVQTLFSFDQDGLPTLDLAGARTVVEPARLRTSKFDLALSITPAASDWRATLRYDTALFDPDDVVRLLDQYRAILSRLVDAPGDSPARGLTASDGPEAERLKQLGRGVRRPRPDRLIPDEVTLRAAGHPGQPALRDSDHLLTYGELDAVSDAIAARLASQGVGPETCVAIISERSARAVAAMLGVLKTGASYLPLDPEAPPRRLLGIVNDAGVRAVLLSGEVAVRLEAEADLGDRLSFRLDRDWELITQDQKPRALTPCLGLSGAYMVYTSGSTGVPKGVLVSHDALANLVDFQRATFEIGPSDRCLQLLGPGFDVAVLEIWGALAAGATLHLPPPKLELDPPALLAYIARHQITVAHLATPLGEGLLGWLDQHPDQTPASLRLLFVGGSALRRLAPQAPFSLINIYGPAEATVATTMQPMPTAPRRGERLPPLGRPLANTDVYLLDPAMGLTPEGAPGEIYIGGAAVGRGYVRRPALTAERFLPDPHAQTPGARMYRSGDNGRWTSEGMIEFLGRKDLQVKINGVRIEIGEIEAQLLASDHVLDAVVSLRRTPDGADRLVAYVAVADRSVEIERWLRRRLEAELPRVMVPQRFVLLEALPLTANGKVDRKALPDPDWDARARALGARRGPETPVEAAILDLWRARLGVQDIGVDDDFFALGGNSSWRRRS
jgi:amino acid adenylation domain-containing protein